jgi:hypothetical protein
MRDRGETSAKLACHLATFEWRRLFLRSFAVEQSGGKKALRPAPGRAGVPVWGASQVWVFYTPWLKWRFSVDNFLFFLGALCVNAVDY